jgi:predicted amidohydrolase YtcJ
VNLLLQKRSSVARSLPLAGILFLSPLLATAQAPDVIFFHGNILTGSRLKAGDSDPVPGRVAALAVRNGSIVAVGTDKDMLALKGPHTSTIDLNGAFAMPGFNDAHTHMASAGQQRLSVDLDGTKSLAEMLSRIQTYSTAQAPGQWVLGGGWDQTKWTGAKLPNKSDLDAVTGDHPAFLERTDGHIAIVNTAALKVAGITDSTPDPKGGKIDRDFDGHATGIIREGPALALIQQRIPPPSYELRRKALELSIEDALAHGVTSVQDFSDWDDWLVFEELEHAGKLNLRVAEWIDFNLTVGDLEQRRSSHPANDPLLHLTMLKGFMDGSLGSRTAAMNDPYSDDPSNSGIPRYDQQKLNQMASARAAAGFQLGFHAIGDLANDMALNALAAAEQVGRPADAPLPPSNPSAAIVDTVPSPPTPASFRFRIEHAQVLSPGAFDRFAQLGIIASMQPSHLLTDMAWGAARLGPERSKRAYAWKSFLDHGVILAFGTDYPVESISPFRGLYSAITRQNEAGTQTFEPQEKLTIQEAIYAYTQASAFAEFREHVKGRLEPGYLADLVVLDRDITKATPQELLHAKVLRTVVGGETRYSSQGVNKQ